MQLIYLLLNSQKGGGYIIFSMIRWNRGQVGLASPPSWLQGNKTTLSPASGEACSTERCPWHARLVLSWNPRLPCPCPVGGPGWDLTTRKSYPQKQCVPWQHITLVRSLALVLSIRLEFQRGVASHLVGINVAVGNALSVIPTQQDKVLPNLLGLVLFGDKFLFSQGVTYEETQNPRKSGLEGSRSLSNKYRFYWWETGKHLRNDGGEVEAGPPKDSTLERTLHTSPTGSHSDTLG